MRWFIDVASSSRKDAPEQWVVEASQWQPALKAARTLRGDPDNMSGFSIELLEDGYRAIDPSTMVRYLVRPAPDGTPVSEPVAPPPTQTAEATNGTPVPPKRSSVPPGASKADRIAALLDIGAGARPSKPPGGSRTVAVGSSVTGASRDSAEIVPPRAGSQPSIRPSQAPRAQLSSRPEAQLAGLARLASSPSLAPAAAAPSVPPIVTAKDQKDQLPPAELLFQREEDPSATSPLTYRETAWLVPEGTSVDAAVRLALGMFEGVRAALAAVPPGKLVNMAVFDHRFQGKPRRAPLATLTWKDWKDKGQGPEIRRPGDPPVSMAPRLSLAPVAGEQASPLAGEHASPLTAAAETAVALNLPKVPPAPAVPSFPGPAPVSASSPPRPTAAVASPSVAPMVPPAPAAASVAPMVPPAPAAAMVPAAPAAAFVAPMAPPAAASVAPVAPPAPAQVSAPMGAPAVSVAPAVAPARAASVTPPPVAVPTHFTPLPSVSDPFPAAPATRSSVPSVPKLRLSGDELIVDLFEAMHDLHFLRDAIEGADFVLSLLMEKLPCSIALVHFYDIDAREFVIVRASGKGTSKVLGIRTTERDPLIAEPMRKRRSVVLADAKDDPRTGKGRWALLGVPIFSLAGAPVEQGGRFLGFLELANPRDGGPFKEGDGHALTYIGEQFAEFLANRGVVIDPDRLGTSR